MQIQNAPLLWSGKTLDGHTLKLTHAGIHRVMSQIEEQPELKQLVKRYYAGDLKQAIARLLAQLVQSAQCTGTLHSHSSNSYPLNPHSSGQQLLVFTTQANHKPYQIIALPTTQAHHTILSIYPGSIRSFKTDSSEFEQTISNLKVPIQWIGPLKFKDVKRFGKGGGIYVVEKCDRNGVCVPIYVGKADNFGVRVGKGRLEVLRQMAVDLSPYRLFLGHVPHPKTALLTKIEHVILREIKNRGKGRYLTNLSPKQMFKVGVGGIDITNTIPNHSRYLTYIRPRILLTQGRKFEISDL